MSRSSLRRAAALTLVMTGTIAGLPMAAHAAVPGTLTGHVYWDVDQDGVKDANEPGLDGVAVTITNKTTNAVNTVWTDATGLYTVAGPTAADYELKYALPADYTASPGKGADNSANPTTVTISDTSEEKPVNFGVVGQGAITGTAFHDADADASLDAGETKLGGATVELLNVAGAVLMSTTAAADGTYTLPKVAPGQYTVRVRATGYAPFTSTPVTATGAATVPANGPLTRLQAKVSGVMWDDLNANGVRDASEPVIGGGIVMVMANSPTNPYMDRVNVQADGTYTFDLEEWGEYELLFVAPNGYDTHKGTGSVGDGVTFTAGATNLSPVYNSGVVKAAKNVITGVVFEDSEADGLDNDEKEPPIKGVTVTLVDADGEEYDTATTDAAGFYRFADLPNGDYTVKFDTPKGFRSKTGTDSVGTSSKVTVNGNVTKVVKSGFYQPGTISGTICFDANANKECDASEKVIPNATMMIEGPSGTVSTKSDAKGNYSFTDLTPGKYKITFTVPDALKSQVKATTVSGTVDVISGETSDVDAFIMSSGTGSAGGGSTGGSTGSTGSTGSGSTGSGNTTAASATRTLANTGNNTAAPVGSALGLIGAGMALLRRRYRRI